MPWFLCGLLFVIVLILLVKILLLKKSMDEICEGLEIHVSKESNTLISISSRDKKIRRIAIMLNEQLRLLRKQRHQYLNGDLELKEAVINISHDLRTPLTAICGYLDLFENVEKSETVCRYLEIIRGRTEIMKGLTEELFRYSMMVSSQGQGETELTNVGSVLEESIVGFYGMLGEKNIVPNLYITSKKVVRKLSPRALSRVFTNLLNNVVNYSDGDLDITLTETGQIIFKNTASALDEVLVGKLFNRFYTVESGEKSTGLGLAIARTLLEQMNGTIEAEYKNNQLCISILLSDASDE